MAASAGEQAANRKEEEVREAAGGLLCTHRGCMRQGSEESLHEWVSRNNYEPCQCWFPPVGASVPQSLPSKPLLSDVDAYNAKTRTNMSTALSGLKKNDWIKTESINEPALPQLFHSFVLCSWVAVFLEKWGKIKKIYQMQKESASETSKYSNGTVYSHSFSIELKKMFYTLFL